MRGIQPARSLALGTCDALGSAVAQHRRDTFSPAEVWRWEHATHSALRPSEAFELFSYDNRSNMLHAHTRPRRDSVLVTCDAPGLRRGSTLRECEARSHVHMRHTRPDRRSALRTCEALGLAAVRYWHPFTSTCEALGLKRFSIGNIRRAQARRSSASGTCDALDPAAVQHWEHATLSRTAPQRFGLDVPSDMRGIQRGIQPGRGLAMGTCDPIGPVAAQHRHSLNVRHSLPCRALALGACGTLGPTEAHPWHPLKYAARPA